MAIDCSDVPSNLTYDCANPWGQGCTSDEHFQFISLWKYTLSIQNACANDTRLFTPHGGIASPRNASLTQASCIAIAGSDWTYYPTADIWARLTTWKFPLLQLVASFPRPPLGFWIDVFVIAHLLGDPVDTLQNLLAKMSSCTRDAKYWRAACEKLLVKRVEDDEDYDWKALALLTDAYGEWDADGQAKNALHQGLHDNHQHKNELASAIRQTGCALAADRSTKFLPIIVAQVFFIGAVGIAIFRTASAAGVSASNDTVFINVEAHSIAFSALYFWIIPTVFLGSIIGVSQTEAAIPRILRSFQVDVERLKLPKPVQLPNDCLDGDQKRIFHGGVYSWQPQRRYPSRTSLTYHNVLSYLIVIMGTVTAVVVSAFVPPDGLDCRHVGEILILIAWLLSALVNVLFYHLWPLDEKNQRWNENNQIMIENNLRMNENYQELNEDNPELNEDNPELNEDNQRLNVENQRLNEDNQKLNMINQRKLFWATGIKDLLVTIATMGGGVITTQLGLFNRCSCYTQWGRTGLALPEMPDVAETLFHRLNTAYPAIAFTGIGLELVVIPLFICIPYMDALRTFVQRDDRKSNAKWLWRILGIVQASKARIQAKLSKNTKRTETWALEMQPLAQTFSGERENINTEYFSSADAPVTEEQSEPTAAVDPISRSSGVDPPSRTGTNLSSDSESRRRNNEREAGLAEDQPLFSRDST